QALLLPEIGGSPGLTSLAEWHRPSDDPDHEGLPRVGDALNAAVVVLDVESSELLAAVSHPAMPLDVLVDAPELIYDDELNMPYLNRALSRGYEPGSTVKPLVLMAAIN